MIVAFYNPAEPSFYAICIRLKTGSKYVHVELLFDELPPAKPGTIRAFSATPAEGVRWADLPWPLSPAWDTIPLPKNPTATSRAILHAQTIVGHEYDFLGILGIDLGTGEHSTDSRFCSETAADEINYAYGVSLGDPWRISPGDLYNLLTKGNITWPDPPTTAPSPAGADSGKNA